MTVLNWLLTFWFKQIISAIVKFVDPTWDQISATTLADLRDSVVYDNFFVDGATLRKLRASGALDEYTGGTVMQTPFQFDRVNGGAYAPGTDVTVTQKNILAATAFVPRAYKEDIALNLWQTNVINSGPAARVKLVDAYMTNAVQSANTDINIDLFRHGQNISGSNRILNINGISEALNDGVNPSWDGNVFTNYGSQLRNGAVTNTLNSVPIWAGAQDGSTGQISYKLLLEAYWNCVQEPDLGICNKAAFAYIQERQEVKQRFNVETDPSIGLSGIRIMNAYVMVDKLAPSTKYGQLTPAGLSQTTAIKPTAFTTPTLSATQRAISNYPSVTSCTPGEIFFWLRTKGWKIRPTADPEYNFNFTPFVRSQQNPDLIVCFFKIGLNLYCVSPRDNEQIVGIGF